MAERSLLKRLFGRKKKIRQPSDAIKQFTFTRMKVNLQDHAFQQERIVKPTVANPILGYKGGTRAPIDGGFEDVEYDLSYLLRIEDIESYLRQANAKKLTLFMKEGWDLVGGNPTTVKYVKKRLRQMAKATNISTEQLIRSTASDLIKLSNCFWLYVRDENKSGGKTVNGMKPIAGIFIIPAETVVVKSTKNGQIVSLQQRMPDGRRKTYSKNNVAHFSLYRKNGFAIGTPAAWPVVDDILALRRIEENVEKLIYRDLFPIYQYKVGTETLPARVMPGGWDEVEDVKDRMENMPPEGIYVTPERHDIKVIGHEGRALRIEGYIKHFNNRVLSGLGLSSIDVGIAEGASKSSAETMSQALVDEVKHMQSCFEDMFDNMVIRTLLIESDFKFDTMDPENVVRIKFKEIDLAQQLKIQNHYVQLFTQHAINHNELRTKLGELPADDEWWETSFWKLIAEPEALISATDEPYSPAAQALAKASNTAIEPGQLAKAQATREKEAKAAEKAKASATPAKNMGNRGRRSGSASDRPSNQHGKKLEPISRTNSLRNLRDSRMHYPHVFEVFREARGDALQYTRSEAESDMYVALLQSAKEEFKLRFTDITRAQFIEGYREIRGEDPRFLYSMNAYDIVNNYVSDRVDAIFKEVEKEAAGPNAIAIYDQVEWRVNLLLRTEPSRAANYGRLVACKEAGVKVVEFQCISSERCDQCDKISMELRDIRDLSLLSIPPHHPNCGCILRGANNRNE